MHATTYSDMARTEPEVQQAIQTLPALPARPGKDNTVTAPPAVCRYSCCLYISY